ncbi:MAG: hypothetical protein IKU26_05450 [Clostridia bacterium]|nr:hypothetical protein [Clostridia bacterium]
MAQFTNQAQLTYNNEVVNSNVAVGEVLETVAVSKTAITETYTQGDTVVYVISIVNSGGTALQNVTVSDDLGAYTFGGNTLYPLAYTANSVRYYVNGILQPAPAENPGPPLTFTGISIPANGNATLVYETTVTQFAPLGVGDSVTNTVTVSGENIPTAQETITPEQAPDLTITKSIDPIPVNDGDRVTYTFVIQNYGNTPAVASDNASVTDTFNPVLTGITVAFNGTAWTLGTEYTYSEVTGVFVTDPGQITVPAATYTQNPVTGEWTVVPGVSTLVVTGTI